jgi:hypothetical protein
MYPCCFLIEGRRRHLRSGIRQSRFRERGTEEERIQWADRATEKGSRVEVRTVGRRCSVPGGYKPGFPIVEP